jgi:hypothetical protein
LRTDEKHVRTQSAILHKNQPQTVVAFIHNRVFGTDRFYPYQKHDWCAQRAGLLAACDSV